MLRALLLGDAQGGLAEAEQALAMFTPDAIFACNNIGIDWPHRLDYWCTLHNLPCEDWIGISEAVRKRVALGRNRPQVWSYKPGRDVDCETGNEHCAEQKHERPFEQNHAYVIAAASTVVSLPFQPAAL